ncbi:MAG: tetratricopeptide repeat protein [Acidobacteriota bacterium]|nr:tetratricopeptide repeat protein [Acidobacteriota bacterium]
MSADAPDRLFELFNAALDAEGEAREAIFRSAEAEDPELGAELRRKVARFAEVDEHFESSPFGRISDMVSDQSQDTWGEAYGAPEDLENAPTLDLSMKYMPDEDLLLEDPEQIGDYQIEGKIGEGGMGAVYLARQQNPDRKVALKLIHRHKVSPAFLNRFNREYSVLAMMTHHNIATIYEAGKTMMGDPFFSMEYVEGKPINEFCSEHKLTLRERLRLFMQVCDGVLHAHQKAVVHRDLKPNNIMVALENGQGVVKLIDFGIAKDLNMMETAYQTQAGLFMGTPVYMGPEQIEQGGGGDIRSDIYALGVVLYELLTGLTPIDPTRFENSSLFDMLKHYKDTTPPRPSERLRDTAAADALRHFKLDLRGDLDWVVMKAMDKNIDRRYQTAAELKADLTHFLNGEPVSARPPTFAYQMAKFIQRNKILVFAGLMVFVALITALVVSRSALDQAETALRQQQQANVFLESVLSAPDPRHGGINTRIVDALDDAERRLENVTDPILEANIRTMLGNTFFGLGKYDRSALHHQRAVEIRTDAYGENDAETLRSRFFLTRAWRRQREYKKAQDSFTEIMTIQQRVLGRSHLDTLESVEGLAMTLHGLGRYAEAGNLYEDIIDSSAPILEKNPRMKARILHGLAICYRYQAKYSKALPFYEAAGKLQIDLLGDGHPETLATLANKANCLKNMKRLDEALPLFQFVLEKRMVGFGPEHRTTISSHYSSAVCLLEMERYEDALPHILKTLEYRMQRGLTHPATVRVLQLYATVLHRTGDSETALGILEDLASKPSSEDWLPAAPFYSMTTYAEILLESGESSKALDILQQNVAEIQESGTDSHLYEAWMILGKIYLARGGLDLSAEYFCRAWALFDIEGATIETIPARVNLGIALTGLGLFEDAEIHLKTGLKYQTHMAAWEQDVPIKGLVALYRQWGREVEAEKYQAMLTASQEDIIK